MKHIGSKTRDEFEKQKTNKDVTQRDSASTVNLSDEGHSILEGSSKTRLVETNMDQLSN